MAWCKHKKIRKRIRKKIHAQGKVLNVQTNSRTLPRLYIQSHSTLIHPYMHLDIYPPVNINWSRGGGVSAESGNWLKSGGKSSSAASYLGSLPVAPTSCTSTPNFQYHPVALAIAAARVHYHDYIAPPATISSLYSRDATSISTYHISSPRRCLPTFQLERLCSKSCPLDLLTETCLLPRPTFLLTC
jgi:hypothetical protein